MKVDSCCSIFHIYPGARLSIVKRRYNLIKGCGVVKPILDAAERLAILTCAQRDKPRRAIIVDERHLRLCPIAGSVNGIDDYRVGAIALAVPCN